MLLSEADIELLEGAGYARQGFVRFDRQGFAKLRNNHGYCVFYDAEGKLCKAYRLRPQGCRIYPVIYSMEEAVIVDDLCPQMNTVTNVEIERKGRKLARLLEKIDYETKSRKLSV
jgi:Fe-S-cluster containining protein